MGVEFNNCPACDEVYCDAGEYHHCKKCGHTICGDCERKYSEIHQDDPDFCPFCCGDIVTNDMKLEGIKKLLEEYPDDKVYQIQYESAWIFDEVYYMGGYDLAKKIKEILDRN